MTQLAFKTDHLALQRAPSLSVIPGGLSDKADTPSKHIIFLGCALVLLQILDGLLTGLGMFQFGTSMEGNLLLRSLMVAFGAIPALFVVKGASIALIIFLCRQARHVRWLAPAFYAVIGIYLVLAVAPWTYILLDSYFA